MNISLRQLRGFLLLAQLKSFTRAAERLHITQAGLSAMMRDLEDQFECRLFDRTTRSVSLTKEGASLVTYAERAVGEIDAAKGFVKLSVHASRRILTIASTPVFASVLAPTICRVFAGVDPDVDVRILDVPRSDIQALVERGDADVGFGIFLKRAAGTELRLLTRFPLVYIAPAGTLGEPLKVGGMSSLNWSRLPALPLISLSPETPVQEVIQDCLNQAGIIRSSRQVCNTMQTVLALVAEGFGATILPAMVVPSCPTSRFDVARLTEPLTYLDFYQITKKGHELPAVVEPFVETLVEEVVKMCGLGVEVGAGLAPFPRTF